MHSNVSSALNRIKHKLQELLGRVKAADYTENDEDVQTIAELMDEIRDAVTDHQVSGDSRLLLRSPHSDTPSRRRNSRSCMIRVSN